MKTVLKIALASLVAAGTLAPTANAQLLGKGLTPQQELQRITNRHLYLGSFISRSVREAAGPNTVLGRDNRVSGQFGVCSFTYKRSFFSGERQKVIVCERI